MKCLNCQSEFVYVRSTAKYCSAKCKKAYQRRVRGTDKVVSETKEILKELPKKKYSKSKNQPFAICPKHRCFYHSCGC